MEHKHNNSSGGFLFGILVGVAITLLFTTKKGRKILKTLTDEGFDKISGLEDLFEKRVMEEDLDDDMPSGIDYIEPKPPVVHPHHEHVAPPPPIAHQPAMHEPIAEQMSQPDFISPVEPEDRSMNANRRFFRGIPKRTY